jgi:hypothetical protein
MEIKRTLAARELKMILDCAADADGALLESESGGDEADTDLLGGGSTEEDDNELEDDTVRDADETTEPELS